MLLVLLALCKAGGQKLLQLVYPRSWAVLGAHVSSGG
jgi:hypothetical protein